MSLHYQHQRFPTPEVDYLPLTVELWDESQGKDVVSERYYLPIYIKGALPNSPPHASFINMYMMDVNQFVLTTIVPGIQFLFFILPHLFLLQNLILPYLEF